MNIWYGPTRGQFWRDSAPRLDRALSEAIDRAEQAEADLAASEQTRLAQAEVIGQYTAELAAAREEARKWEWVAHNWPFDDEEECCDCNRCEDGRRDIIIDLLARYQPGGESGWDDAAEDVQYIHQLEGWLAQVRERSAKLLAERNELKEELILAHRAHNSAARGRQKAYVDLAAVREHITVYKKWLDERAELARSDGDVAEWGLRLASRHLDWEMARDHQTGGE